MQLRKRIKANAKIALKRQWGKAIAILMAIFATAVFFSVVEQLFCKIFSLPTFEQLLRSVYQAEALSSGEAAAVCSVFLFSRC